ncbi:MAG: hypothetical protein ACRDN7_11145 [Rubrobacter sp.]
MGELRRTQERERAERYLGVYTVPGLRSIAHEDGAGVDLESRGGR